MKSPVVKRSIVLAGHKTRVSLEDAFWRGLKEIAGKRVMSLSDLVGTIDSQRHQQGNLPFCDLGASGFTPGTATGGAQSIGSPPRYSSCL
jgi:Ribbon-helix-helix domain